MSETAGTNQTGYESIEIERRFCGPPESGNGGYVAGRLAAYVDSPAVGVRLRLPPPLDTRLVVQSSSAGDRASLYADEVLVAEARAAEVDLVAPTAPTFDEAESAAGDFRGFHDHVFPHCFVCGPGRAEGDGLRIFPGSFRTNDPQGSDGLFAAPWIPDSSLVKAEGTGAVGDPIAQEFLWAALDCPGAFSFPQPQGKVILLGEMKVALRGDVFVGERCVLASWRIETQGRKHFTGSALYGADGECRGVALGLWFEVDPASVSGS